MALAAGFDGSININTKIDSTGFNKGVKNMNGGLDGITSSLKGLAAAVGLAFGIAAVVNFGKASVKASTDLTNAMTGLKSIVDGQGRSFSDAQNYLQKYIADGLIPATDAVTAYKNLAMRGYTDPQIQSTLTALKDSAAFGRQASLTLGQAVSTATEGLKNENSILVDNAGVTKNVSVMWADYATSIGVGVDSLTKQQKIQAEVTGIMRETRFQTGDAAKIAATYSSEVLKLGYNFNNLKIAIGNALIPIAQAVLPSINAIITALTRMANLFAQVTTALFGKQAVQQQNVANTASNIASSSTDAAKAQNKLADAAKKAGKAADGSLASFDELNVWQQDTASGGTTADSSTPDVSVGATIDPIGGQEIGAGVTVSPAMQAAADTVKGILADIDNALEPTKAALAGVWAEFQRLGGFAWQGLLDFYNLFLVPVGNWIMGVGLPGFITAMKDGMSKIDWAKINTSLYGLWSSLTPFAKNVGEGLLWFWKNVLVPLGTWTMNNVVPLFIDILAASIRIINEVIEALKPLALWLFDNFLKPIAEWTGGVIVSVLTSIKDALIGISDWISNNQAVVQGMAVTVGLFFAAWKATELLAFIQTSGGILAVLGSLTSSIAAGTVAKLVDKAETIALTAIYAKDFVVSVAQGTAALVTNAAQWVATTAVKIADTVAQWAAIAATAAWNAICAIASAVTWAFGAAIAFLTSPIGLVILAIAAVIAIVVLLITHWDQVKAAAAACWAWIVSVWNVAAGWFNTNVVQPLSKFFTALWDGIKAAAKKAWDGIVAIWTIVSGWFNTTVIQPVGKFFTGLWDGISAAAGNAWKTISAVWETVSGWFYDKVIAPIESAFKGSINFLIGLFEGFINSFINGINVVIGLLNNFKVDIPDWDIFGDMRGQSFGFSIPKVGALSIPRLATGAVIPPRAEFAAILGDQHSGRNLEAPESLLRDIVRQEVGGILGSIDSHPSFRVEATGSMGQLVSLMRLEIRKEDSRIGTQLVTGGGR